MICRGNLGVRLTLILGLTLAVFTAVLVIVLTLNHRAELLREVTFSTHRLAETVERGIRHYMLTPDHDEIRRTLLAISRQHGIETIRIFSKQGKITCSSDETEVGTMVDKQAEACYQCHAEESPLVSLKPLKGARVFTNEKGERTLAVIEVIHNDPTCWNAACHAHPKEQKVLGILDVAVSLKEMDIRLAGSTRAAVLTAFLSIVTMCGLTAVSAHRLVRRPILRLLKGVQVLGSGDFNHSIPVTSSDEIGQLTKSFNDMTQRLAFHIRKLTETQEQLFHSEKLASLGKMAAGVAHELNSPLTVILNDSSLLLRRLPKGSSEYDDVSVIADEAKRCGEIIHGLLEFTRLERPETRPTSINEVVRDSVQLIRHQAILGDISVGLELTPDLPNVDVDPSQMKQVFLDIMTNAVHAMSNGGSLTVSSGPDGGPGFVAVSFADTGCGISKDHIDKIFQPFFTTKEAKEGTGLGLAICYEIIQKHGGRIDVTSCVGKGTTFTVKLPVPG